MPFDQKLKAFIPALSHQLLGKLSIKAKPLLNAQGFPCKVLISAGVRQYAFQIKDHILYQSVPSEISLYRSVSFVLYHISLPGAMKILNAFLCGLKRRQPYSPPSG